MAERHRAGVAIVTLCVRGAPARTPANNAKRVALLRKAVISLSRVTEWPRADAIVLPAGYFRIDRYLGNLPDPQRRRQLAEFRVPRRHLSDGTRRKAWPFLPADDLPVTPDWRTAAVLRLYRLTG